VTSKLVQYRSEADGENKSEEKEKGEEMGASIITQPLRING
jgi:hypothetical protein